MLFRGKQNYRIKKLLYVVEGGQINRYISTTGTINLTMGSYLSSC